MRMERSDSLPACSATRGKSLDLVDHCWGYFFGERADFSAGSVKFDDLQPAGKVFEVVISDLDAIVDFRVQKPKHFVGGGC